MEIRMGLRLLRISLDSGSGKQAGVSFVALIIFRRPMHVDAST